jgi:hypothetical protein
MPGLVSTRARFKIRRTKPRRLMNFEAQPMPCAMKKTAPPSMGLFRWKTLR